MPQNKIRTEDIVDSQITYAKIQNVSNNNLLLGRNTAGAGLIEELNAATAKAILALNNVENVALSTWTGSTNINTLGTITQGTWSGSTISIDKGGTGLNTLGTANQVLAVNSGGTALQYVTPLSGTGTSGQVTFWTGGQTQTGNQGLTYTTTENGRLYVGTPSGDGKLNLTRDAGDNYFYHNTFSATAGHGNYWFVRKSASNTAGTLTETTNSHFLGGLYYQGVNTSNAYAYGAQIIAQQLGASGAFVPTSLIFRTYSSAAQNANQLVLSPNSNVGISTGSPAARLHVVGSSTGTTAWTAQFHNSGGTSNSLMIRDDGNVAIGNNSPNARLQVHGADIADTGWTAQFHNVLGNSNSLMIRNDGNVGIGTNAPAAKLEVDPIVNQTGILVAGYSLTGSSTIPAIDITGAWNTSGIATLIRGNLTNNVSAATSRLIDLQVSGTSQFRVLPNGTINGSELTGQLTGTIAVRSNLTNVAGNYVTIDNNTLNITTTTGIVSGVIIRSSYIPPSGTGVFVGLNLNHTINQSSGSGSTGITRGLLVNPFLTSAFDWRSIEWTNNTGWGLYGSGTANNYLAGNLSVGTSGTTARLVVRGSGATSGSTTMLVENSGGTSMLMVRDDGNVGIGTNAPAAKLQINGGGNTSATTAITVQNSDNNSMFYVENNGGTYVQGRGASNVFFVKSSSGANLFYVQNAGVIGFTSLNWVPESSTGAVILDASISRSWNIGGAAKTITSGIANPFVINTGFAPTSGTATYNGLTVNPTINQSGGASGTTRGLYVNPTLTSAFDWRSIEWTNSSGWGLYGEGTANNYLGGNLSVGTTGSTAKLVVVGSQPSGTTTWTAQFHNALGNSNSLMIRDDGNVGIGTNAPSSRLDVVGTVEFQNPSTTYDTPSFGSELLTTGAGTNWTGTSFASGYTHTSGSTAALTSAFTPTNGQFYRIVVTTTGVTTGSTTVTFGGLTIGTLSTNTTITVDDRTSSTAALVFTPTSEFNGTVTASIRLISASSPQFVGKDTAGSIVYEERFNASTNLFQGVGAGRYNTTGYANVFQGNLAGSSNTSGNRNIFQGEEAGKSNTVGTTNVFQGYLAGRDNTSGYRNIFQGYAAGITNTTGFSNIFQGVFSGGFNTTGYFNIFQGEEAGYNNTTGNRNIFQGAYSGRSNTTGTVNIFLGYQAGFSNTTGSGNIFQGESAAYSNVGGNNNVAIGFQAGRYIVAGLTGNTLISNSILIGHNTRALASGQTNQVVIGYEGRGLGSNTTVIGNSSTTQTWLGGSLSLGTQVTPAARLHAVGTGSGNTTWTAQFHNVLGDSNSLMIRDDGNVGIGTNDIIAKLNISGSVRHIAPTNGNGGVLGTQLTITGSGTNWSGTSFTDGYTHTVGSTAALTTATSIVTLNSYYQLRIVISNRTAGFITVFLGGQSFFYNTNNDPFGDIQSIKATSTSALIVTPTSDFDGTVQVFVNEVTSGIAAFSGMTSNGVVLGVEERYSPTNVFIGKSAGMNNIYTLGTYGSNNVFIGHETGIYNVTGYQNMFLGSQAGRENISGSANLFLGNQAGRNNTMGYNNMFQGSQAGFLNTVGSFNVFQGVLAGYFNTSGNSNVFTGYSAGYNNTVGLDNVFQGVAAGFSNTTGGSNTFVGRGAGYSNTTGNWNVFQGFASGFNNTNGSLNVSIGYLAGYYITAGTINTKLDNSILIGHDTRVPATGQTNQIVIGDQARGLGSNTTVIGNTGTTISLIHGNVSAGETNPKNKLETSGSFGRGSLVQVSTSSYTVGNNDTWIRVSTASGTVALTLPDATAWIRREIMIIKTSGATVISASANVVKFAGAGTAILGGDDLRCTLVSDGTNWYFM